MRSQLSGRWFLLNQVGNVVVLFYFSNLGEEEEAEAGYRRKVMSVHHATKRQQA